MRRKLYAILRNLIKGLIITVMIFMETLPLSAQNLSLWKRLGPFGGAVNSIQRDGRGQLWATGYGGLFRSNNNGQSWQLAIGLSNGIAQFITTSTNALVVHDSVIVAGFYGGTLTSSDYGAHWNIFHFRGDNGTPVSLSINNDTLYLTANYAILLKKTEQSTPYPPAGILQSTDMGRTWHTFALIRFSPYIVVSTKSRFYVLTRNNDILYSDTGADWDTLKVAAKYGTPSSLVSVTDTAIFFGTSNGLYRIIGKTPVATPTGLSVDAPHVYSDGERLFVSSGTTLFWSDNLGQTWQQLSQPDVHVNDAAISKGDILLATTEKGLIRHPVGAGHWTSANTGLTIADIADASSFALSPDDSIYAAIGNQGLKRYEEDGSWSAAGPDSTTIISVGFSGDGILYALSDNSLYQRTSSDYSWSEQGLPDLPYNSKRLYVSDQGNLYLQNYQSIKEAILYRSVDKGIHWDSLRSGGTIKQLISNSVGQLYGIINEELYLSVDSGDTWQSLSAYSGGAKIESIYDLADDSLLVGTNHQGVFVVTSQGKVWKSLGNPGDDIGLIAEGDMGYIFIYSFGRDKAFAWSRDNPAWREISFPDLTSRERILDYSRMLIDHHHRVVFWGKGHGIYRSTVNTHILPIDQNSSGQPSHFLLRQNYPNPFNPTTTIRYELAHPALVRLTVYNILGQQVSVLVNGREPAGTHQVTFDASPLRGASGVYFYRLRANGKMLVRKMLLMK